jgi:glycosyltransferase involved in cell wall biosynthesis
MDHGGIETWLMHILRHIDRRRFQLEFLVHAEAAGAYDDEIRALGSRVIRCLNPSHPWTFARNFRRILREDGPYDIVHSHVHHFSGFTLRLAAQSGVPVRIAHSHSDTSPVDCKAGLLRRAYLSQCVRWLRRYATAGLAASGKAAESLYGKNWPAEQRWRLLYCGVDLAPFRQSVDRSAIRAELKIHEQALVIGHVGRLEYPKNHGFLVEVAAEVAKREPRAVLLLVGDGALRPQIERQVAALGIGGRVAFAGTRTDIALMLGAMDVFAFPSIYEGLPLALIEAQAAALPCVVSDAISAEAHIVKALVTPLSLAAPASTWAEAILSAHRDRPLLSRTAAWSSVEQSPFNIESSFRALEAIYREC